MDSNQEPLDVSLSDLARLELICPVCEGVALYFGNLERDLPAYQCRACSGVLLISTHYWDWIAQQGQEAAVPPALPSEDVPPVVDSEQAKRCPIDGHIMLRYEVATNIAFNIEQCGRCNSFWLDRTKWEVLKSRNLHTRLHKVSTPAWQRHLREKRSQQFWRQTYRREFGSDYAEVQRLRGWLRQHPKREQILAYLAREEPYND